MAVRSGLCGLVLAIGLVVGLVIVPNPALAEPAGAEVDIVLDSLSPLVPRARDDLHISGSVVNASRATIDKVRIVLRKSSSPLDQASRLAAVASAERAPTDGSPDDVALPGTQVTVAERLAPGDRARFDISLPMKTLALPEPGTYVLGLEATGDTTLDGEHRLADLRTFLPWYPSGTVEPVTVAWLWPLASAPDRNAAGVFLDERLPAELAPGGRLSRLLSLGLRQRDSVTWIADPALLQAVADMSDGYLVNHDGTARAGDREGAATTWLTRLREAAGNGARLRTVPYAAVDASAVTRAGLSTDVVRAVTQGPAIADAVIGGTTAGSLYWAPGGRIDRSALDVLASAGITTVVLGSSAMPPSAAGADLTTTPIAAVPTSVGSMRAILADSALTELLSRASDAAGGTIATRQQFLAYTALAAEEAQARGVVEPVLVAAPPTMVWDPADNLVGSLLRATRQAPWLKAARQDELAQVRPSTASRQRVGYGTRARGAELSESYMASVRGLSDRLASFTSIIDDPTGVTEPYAAALLRAESAAWRGQPAAAQKLLRSIGSELSQDTSRVRVLSSGNVTLSGDAGKVPVTIANDLDRSVTVGLQLIGHPALRLESAPVEAITIEPGKMASVEVDVRVVGGDPLDVDVQLITSEGAPFAEPAVITVMSTAYSRAAAWVVAAAFLAIVVFVIVGVTRRIHAARSPRSKT